MKRLILFLLVTTTLSSQIKRTEESVLIGDYKQWGFAFVKCSMAGDTYTFWYTDASDTNSNDYLSFSFDDIGDSFESFYTIIMEGFEEIPEAPVVLELQDSKIQLEYTRPLGVTNMRFSTDKGASV